MTLKDKTPLFTVTVNAMRTCASKLLSHPNLEIVLLLLDLLLVLLLLNLLLGLRELVLDRLLPD